MKNCSIALPSPRDDAVAWTHHVRRMLMAVLSRAGGLMNPRRARQRRRCTRLSRPYEQSVQQLLHVVQDDRREWSTESRP
jgi:hypothetical protein